MAENPINNKDFYDGNGKPFEAVVNNVIDLQYQIAILNKSLLESVKALKAMTNATSAKEVKAQADETLKLEKATTQLAKAELELQKQEVILEKAIREKIKAETIAKSNADAQTKATESQTSAYKKQSDELISLRKKYKDLAVEEKHTTDEGKKLLKQIEDLDAKLKKVDATVGQHQRSVGNYEKATSSLVDKLKQWDSSTLKITGTVAGLAGGLVAGIGVSKIWNNVLENTAWLSKEVKLAMAGVSTATGEFFSMLGNMDFSNFIDNLTSAYKAGYEFEKQLGAVKARTKALESEEADNAAAQAKRLVESKDRTKSVEERTKAIEKYLEVAKEEANLTIEIAKKEVEANSKRAKTLINVNAEDAKWFTQTRLKRPEIEKEANSLIKLAEANTMVYKQTGRSGFLVEDINLLKKKNDAQNIINKSDSDAAKFAKLKQKITAKDSQIFEDLRLSRIKLGQANAEFDEKTRKAQALYSKFLEETTKKDNEVIKKRNEELDKLKAKQSSFFGSALNRKTLPEDTTKKTFAIDNTQQDAGVMASKFDELDKIEAERTAKINKDKEDQLAIHEATKQSIIQATYDFSNALLDGQSNRIQQAKAKELAVEGLTAKQKEDIEKKYAKKEKEMAYKKAIMNGALAVVNAALTVPYIPAGVAAMNAALISTGAAIAVIATQKFSKGGTFIEGGRSHAEGGNRYGNNETERGEMHGILSVEKTKKYGKFYEDITDAINQDKLDLFSLNFQRNPILIVNNDNKRIEAIAEKQLQAQKETLQAINNRPIVVGNTIVHSNGSKTTRI